MSTVFRSSILAQLGWTWRDEQDRFAVIDSNQWPWRLSLLEGNENGQANAVWYVVARTIPPGASVQWVLDNLPREVFGGQITQVLTAVKALYAINRAESSGTLVLGGAATNPWPGPCSAGSQTLRITPGGVLLAVEPNAGWPVSSSAKNLKLAAEGGSVTYDLVLFGVKPV